MGGNLSSGGPLAARDRFISLWREVLPPTHAEVLIAMATGERTGFPPEIEEDFARTGLGHLLAVSGGPTSAWSELSSCSLGASCACLGALGQALSAVGIFFYVLAIGPRPSAWRALLMALGAIVGLFLHRRADGLSLWALAALVLLLVNPSNGERLAFNYPSLQLGPSSA